MHVLVHRKAVLGVMEGRPQHVAQVLSAQRLEHGQIGVDGSRHREGKMCVGSGAGGDPIEPASAKEADGGERRGSPLAAHRAHLPSPRVVDHGHALAAQRVGRGRLHHRRREARGHRRVEGVAAAEEHAHAGHGDERMTGRHHAVRARDHGACCRLVRLVVLGFEVAAGGHRSLALLAPSPCPLPLRGRGIGGARSIHD